MSAFIAEVKSWQDIGGIPVVNGKIFIGVAGADPKLSPITIFSDRALTVVLANPQLTDSFGDPVNKIWIPGRYSIKVEDSLGNQVFQELDNGEEVGTQTLSLTNVLGINAITADASPTITALTDKAQFVFQVVSENTADAVTLDIDSLGAKAIKRNYTLDVGKAKFQIGQTVIVIYNLANDNFEWTNNNQSVILDNQVSIASAATVDLALSDGNSVSVTGHTGPITSFGTVLAGAIFDLTFPASTPVTITSSSIANPSNILCAAVHGLTTADEVIIAGHSGSVPDINGRHTVTVVDTTNYTIPVNVTTGGTGGTSTGVPKITHNATSNIMPGENDIDIEPGDSLRVESLGSGNWRGINFTSALSLSQIATQAEAETGTEDTKIMSPLRAKQLIDAEGPKPEIFTGSGTYNVPNNISSVLVEALGGGGGAGSGASGVRGGGGGGAGGWIKAVVTVTPGGSETVTIGTGGAGGVGAGANGVDGVDTTFGSLVTAGKGLKGGGVAPSNGGVGGTSSTTGTSLVNSAPSGVQGETGGAFAGGDGGGHGSSNDTGGAAGIAGVGSAGTSLSDGGGGGGGSGGNFSGGAGNDGYIIVTPIV